MVDARFTYTRDTIAKFREAGVRPDMFQIGNEITNGTLWPDARLPGKWDNFAGFMKAGIAGVEAGQGGDQRATKACFDKLNTDRVNYDAIGQSYYPWWHGTMLDLRENLAFMAEEYARDIIVVEAACNYRPAEYRKKPAPCPETPAGQREFRDELNRVVPATPNGRGVGLFWWEPAAAGGRGSREFFNQNSDALPVTNVFDRRTRK
jgi:arabinogalactan endo-1,4-beta-galactosidase